MTIIEDTAVIEDNVKIGENCYIGHFVLIRSNVVIGNNTEVRSHCFIDPDVRVGNFVKIYNGSYLCQGLIIEDGVFVGPRFVSTNTRKIKHIRDFDLVIEPPFIKKYSRLGGRVTLLPGVVVGENSLVGAGSVVTKNVPNGEVHIGVPAKYVKMVLKNELIDLF